MNIIIKKIIIINKGRQKPPPGAHQSAHRKTVFAAACLVLALVFACAALIFAVRSPLVVVSDSAFTALYGEKRVRRAKRAASLRLYRNVTEALVSENAGADLVSLAARSAAESPYCVLFPYRYAEGAAYYAKEHPDVPIAVIGGAEQIPPSGIPFIQTDRLADLHRAGALAARLAQAEGTAADTSAAPPEDAAPAPTRILILQQRDLTPDEQRAFLEGTRAGGLDDSALIDYLPPNAGGSIFDEAAFTAVVILGNAAAYLDRGIKRPALLFSWLDPSLTPSSIKAVFDDSIWALAVPAATLARQATSASLPSVIHSKKLRR
jgi:hypothetical protein